MLLFAISPSFLGPPSLSFPWLGPKADSVVGLWWEQHGDQGENAPCGDCMCASPSWPNVQQSMSPLLDSLGETLFRVGPLRPPLPMAGGPAPLCLTLLNKAY